ncbi:MAG: helix-hairpin-helix domain-containing protein [Angelakisella sp.]
MKTLLSRLFSPALALLLVLSATAFTAHRVQHSEATPIYHILNSRASTMEAKEFLRLAAVNINTAGKEQLMSIPSIGEKLSDRIIAYREANGSFTSMSELDNVKGIGAKTIRRIKEYAYVE